MATSVALVQIRDVKKGQILTTIRKEQANYTSLNTQIHDYMNLSGMLSQRILHFKLTETQSNILPFIFSLVLSICVSRFSCYAIFIIFNSCYSLILRLSSQMFLLGSK